MFAARACTGKALLSVAALLVIVSLSLADGVVTNVVAYERDTVVFYFPLMSWLNQQLHQGELPLWTPQFFGGYPIFADGEIGLAYPPVLFALLTLPPDRALIVLRLVHLAIAALGMFLLSRTWELPYASAVLAGVVFTFANFLQAQIHHENIVRTASWLPLMLALIERALRTADWRVQLRWSALAAIALGLAGLSLHSQMLVIDLLILAAYAAFRWAVGPLRLIGSGAVGPLRLIGSRQVWLRRLFGVALVCGPVVVVGLGLAALQLVPLFELAGFSARGSGIPYSESAAYSLTPLGLIQAIFPYVFRGPNNLQWGLWTHWESYLYVGLAPLVLAIVALVCVRRREVAGWGVIGGLGLILSLGQYSPVNLHYLLWLLPGLSALRAPGRFTVIVALAASMLSAYGLAWLGSRPQPCASERRVLPWLSVAVACIGLIVLALHMALMTWPSSAQDIVLWLYLSLPRDSYALNTADVLRGMLWSTDPRNVRVAGAIAALVLITGALWVWQRSHWGKWRGWPSVFIALATADLLIFTWGIHPREPIAKLSAEPQAVRVLEQLPSADGAPNRVLASPALNQVAADRLAPVGQLQEANGYSSLQFVWHRDYLRRVLYVDDGLLDLWNVRYILDPARYGTVSSYKGVSFLPAHALLHAPAGGSLGEQRFSLASRTPVVELRLVTALMGAVDVSQGAPVAEIELRDATDRVVASTELRAGRDTMEWAWNLAKVQPYVKHERVESAGVVYENSREPQERQLSFADITFDRPVTATSLVVRATSSLGEFALYGGAAVGSDGAPDQLFGKTKTKYRQIYVDNDIRVLEDTAAQSRAFLVPRARVAPSLGAALSQMVHQPFRPDQEVILADDANTHANVTSPDRGGSGSANVTAYTSNTVKIHTSASADAWLVLSDTYYPGWIATVDGQPVTVLRGDVLFRVIPVPGGEHDVEFRFDPTSVKLGALISLVALLLCASALVLAGTSRGPRRTT